MVCSVINAMRWLPYRWQQSCSKVHSFFVYGTDLFLNMACISKINFRKSGKNLLQGLRSD